MLKKMHEQKITLVYYLVDLKQLKKEFMNLKINALSKPKIKEK